MSIYVNRKWAIITLADYSSNELDEMILHAIQSSQDTLRKSLDGTKAVLKWDGDTPDIFNGITIYNNSEILTILNTAEWKDNS